MLIVDRDEKETVEDFIDNLFDQFFIDNFQPRQFQKPQRGGNNSQKQKLIYSGMMKTRCQPLLQHNLAA
jgi:hypothetical protein